MGNDLPDGPGGDPQWLDTAEMYAWRSYADGSQRLQAVLGRDLQDKHNLSLSEYRILVMLSESPDGSLRMSDLADGVLASRSRLTHQIRRMAAENMVERGAVLEDGRGVLAVITDVGRKRLGEAAPTHLDGVRARLVDLLTRDELHTLGRIFEKVDDALKLRAT